MGRIVENLGVSLVLLFPEFFVFYFQRLGMKCKLMGNLLDFEVKNELL